MYKKFSYLSVLILLVGITFLGFYRAADDDQINKINVNDDYAYIAINQCFMWVSNNGDGSHDPRTDASGFYWPGGENATIPAIFEDGLIFGGKVGREIRVNGNTHRQGLQAGKILDNGTPDDPSLSKYRVYKIRKGWELLPPGPTRDEYEEDYNNWPVEDGAPWVDVDGDGVYTRGVDQPYFIGDEVLWYVANDMDPAKSTFTYGTLPMGLEFQTTIFGFNRTGDLGDILFKKYLILNKGNTTVRDMIVAYWSDTDMGDANDDYTGCDTLLSLGYTWNGDEDDAGFYGSTPPALGYDFFQGPIVESAATDSAKFLGGWRHGYRNLPMTAFTFYINGGDIYVDPAQGVAEGSVEFYNYMTGFIWNGAPFVDPNTGEETKFVLAGDPVAGTGWYEGDGFPGGPPPGDRRHLQASGPFQFSPGDTQEVVVGIIVGRSTDSKASITELKRKDFAAQIAYDLDFNLTPAPPAPTLHGNGEEGVITLWWEDNAESYDEVDPLIIGQGLEDTTYTFQGYQLWQFSDRSGNDQTLIGSWDIEDDITTVYGFEQIQGEDVWVPKIVGPNLGVRRFSIRTIDALTNSRLKNGNPYYFGVTAYGVSLNSSPTYLESSPVIIEVRPGRSKIDETTPYSAGDNVVAEQIEGYSDGLVQFKIVDPASLTGDRYEVTINELDTDLFGYTLVNATTEDTLLENSTSLVEFATDEFGEIYIPENDTLGQKVFDGFQLLVQNLYRDSTYSQPFQYMVKDVYEVGGGSVWNTPSQNGEWMIEGGGKFGLIWQDKAQQSFGFSDYEIRFGASEASPWYANGYQRGFIPPVVSDSLGEGTVPFSIWDLKDTPDDPSDDERLAVKISDYVRKTGSNDNDSTKAIPDYQWTQLADGTWEQIYAYRVEDPLNLPNPSPRADQTDLPFGALIIRGELPADGTVIRITSLKQMRDGDKFAAVLERPNTDDKSAAASRIDEISVFPNPYFGAHSLEPNKYQRFVRFTGIPTEATIRIFSLSGVFIRRIDKNSTSQYVDWDLLNGDSIPVASGIYIAYIDMPGIGTKTMKLAIIQEQQYIDRL